VEVTAEVVFYADGSFDKHDETAFKRMVARRQGELLEMKKANKIMRDALATQPTSTDCDGDNGMAQGCRRGDGFIIRTALTMPNLSRYLY